jgi:hypothetical protein
MIGFILTFDENKVYGDSEIRPEGPVYGVVMPDGQPYLHEPYCDSYGSMADMQDRYPDARIQMIGPIVPVSIARQHLEEQYKWSKSNYEHLHEEYDRASKALDEYEKLAAAFWQPTPDEAQQE